MNIEVIDLRLGYAPMPNDIKTFRMIDPILYLQRIDLHLRCQVLTFRNYFQNILQCDLKLKGHNGRSDTIVVLEI